MGELLERLGRLHAVAAGGGDEQHVLGVVGEALADVLELDDVALAPQPDPARPSLPLRVDGRPRRWFVLTTPVVLGAADRAAAQALVDAATTVLALLEARRTAREDPLTGLLNRRALFELLDEEVARSRRYGSPLACLLVDVDRFKAVNDRWGHAVGDEVLRGVAAMLREEVRRNDRVGRYGGDEFVVVLPGVGTDQAALAAGRILDRGWRVGPARREAGRTDAGRDDDAVSVRVSIGLAAWTAPEDAACLLGRADTALLAGKRGGRWQLRVAG